MREELVIFRQFTVSLLDRDVKVRNPALEHGDLAGILTSLLLGQPEFALQRSQIRMRRRQLLFEGGKLLAAAIQIAGPLHQINL